MARYVAITLILAVLGDAKWALAGEVTSSVGSPGIGLPTLSQILLYIVIILLYDIDECTSIIFLSLSLCICIYCMMQCYVT